MDDPIVQLDALRETYPILGPMTFEWKRDALTDPPIRLILTVVYNSADSTGRAMRLRFDGIALDVFKPSFYSERFDLYVTREGRDRGWERRFRVTDEHADWIAFWCSGFTIEESAEH